MYYVCKTQSLEVCMRMFVHLNTPDSDMKMRMYTQRNMRHDTHMSYCYIMSFYFNNKYMFWLHLVTNHGSQGRPKTKKKLKCGKIFHVPIELSIGALFLRRICSLRFVRCIHVKFWMCWNNLFMLVSFWCHKTFYFIFKTIHVIICI